jgi:DNA-directed RNA polymerase subunit K
MKYTKFECARILGARSLQISNGAPLVIESRKGSSLEIAREEFENNIIPLKVKRPSRKNE